MKSKEILKVLFPVTLVVGLFIAAAVMTTIPWWMGLVYLIGIVIAIVFLALFIRWLYD